MVCLLPSEGGGVDRPKWFGLLDWVCLEETQVMKDPFDRARSFLYSEGRLLERLLFGVIFEGTAPESIGRLISAYQNPDGGLGHALEPDIRCPESQPLFVEVGLSALCCAGLCEPAISLSICRFLEQVSDAAGLVSLFLESALQSPHASHMTAPGEPGINPTAGICGLLHYQGVDHPWLSRTTRTCCDLLLRDPPLEAHALRSAALLVEHLPDHRLADDLAERIAIALPKASFFIPYAPVKTYGLTPLHFSPSPASRWRRLFTEEQIDGHLTDLMRRQQEDGGWPISWEAPSQASWCEWRGRWTLEALSILVAYGRITVT
jgi:hypothetical protein